jgi:hypothetical protein
MPTTDLYLVSCLDCTGHGTVHTYDQIRLVTLMALKKEATMRGRNAPAPLRLLRQFRKRPQWFEVW